MATREAAVLVARRAQGLTQTELARRAGISRQALGAIESGSYQPGVTVALRLAYELGQSVERLFGGEDDSGCPRIEARWKQDNFARAGAVPARVALGRVNGKVVAMPQPAARLVLTAPGGMIDRAARQRAQVASYRSGGQIDSTILIAGCDPSVTLLGDWLSRQRSGASVASLPCSSSRALAVLLEGGAHAAGVHLKDPKGEEYNLATVRRALGGRPALLVTFARWELGLATSAGNPMGIRGFADFERRRLRMVNRERGSGARAALDEGLKRQGIRTDRVTGYEREFGGHLEVAAAIAEGTADVGVTPRVAANAYGLGFVPLREERYDLVVLERESESIAIKAMLDACNSRRFANELSQFCAYDTEQTGRIVARLN